MLAARVKCWEEDVCGGRSPIPRARCSRDSSEVDAGVQLRLAILSTRSRHLESRRDSLFDVRVFWAKYCTQELLTLPLMVCSCSPLITCITRRIAQRPSAALQLYGVTTNCMCMLYIIYFHSHDGSTAVVQEAQLPQIQRASEVITLFKVIQGH